MSLLLDALKKAAADKEKSAASAEGSDTKNESVSAADDALPAIDDEVFESVSSERAETEYDPVTLAGDDAELDAEEDLDLELDDSFDASDIEADEEKNIKIDNVNKQSQESENTAEQQSQQEDEKPVKKEQVTDFDAEAMKEDTPLPIYNHNDARKILEVSQKKYRNKQRLIYYGMYVFAAALFFVASYLYYTTESLDNSHHPLFKAAGNIQYKAKSPVSNSQNEIAKEESVAERNSVAKTAVPEKKSKPLKTVVARDAANQKAAAITIIKQKKPDPISLLLQRAYNAYQSGNYELAEKNYREVLRRDSKQRDALLGRAAIAVVKRQYPEAKSIYQHTLRLYPEDSIAKSALVDLYKKEISTANESQLKLLLRENPGAAHVHFSLGLVYARQGRIKDSQQSFFDAFSLNKKADYAYNLAVSLDKLSQEKAALDYYKKASALADKEVIHFDEKKLLERIEQLESLDE